MLILGFRLDDNKACYRALQAIPGLHSSKSKKICGLIGVNPSLKLKHLTPLRYEKLNTLCRDHDPSYVLREQQNNIKMLVNMKHGRGLRIMFGLPVRGQRTRTNAKSCKKSKTFKILNILKIRIKFDFKI